MENAVIRGDIQGGGGVELWQRCTGDCLLVIRFVECCAELPDELTVDDFICGQRPSTVLLKSKYLLLMNVQNILTNCMSSQVTKEIYI